MASFGFLFDMDGTLIDSEPSHLAAWIAAVSQCDCGANVADLLTIDYFTPFIGDPSEALARQLVKEFQLSLSSTELADLKTKKFVENAQGRVIDGVLEVMGILKTRGNVFHLCTASDATTTHKLLTGTPLDAIFSPANTMRTTRDDVTVSKPAADPYLRAAKLSNKHPKDCIAFEDSLTGMQSATAAGVTHRLGIIGTFSGQALTQAGATSVFATFREAADHALNVLSPK